MNQVASTKHFDAIHDAYAFFLDHSTETEQDEAAYWQQLRPLAAAGRPVRLLDFGGGDGANLGRLLKRVAFAPDRLHLDVVEPDAAYRRQAVARLQAFTRTPVAAWPTLPAPNDSSFDCILSNHVLYYVPNLAETVDRLRQLLAPQGRFLTTMGDRENGFSKLVRRLYAGIGLAYPHQEAEELEAVLAASGQAYRKIRVDDVLRFPDTPDNRLVLLRFMLGDFFARLDRAVCLAALDAWAEAGDIVLRTFHFLFVIRK